MNNSTPTPLTDACQCTDGSMPECDELAENSRQLESTAAALARDLEGACRRLAELGEPIHRMPDSLTEWNKMKEGV